MARLARLARVAPLVGLLTCLAAAEARADARECVRNHAAGQDAVREAKLLRAKQSFLSCAVPACPAEVRDECTRLAQDVENRIPSVVIVVSDAAGADVVDAHVFANETRVADRIDGRALQLDPGIVDLRIQTGATALSSRFVIREGEKNRPVVFRLDAPAAAKQPEPKAPPQEPHSSGGVPTAAWIAGGVGVVALGGFGYFAIVGRNKENDLERCTPFCSQDEYDSMKQRYLLADIALGVGVIALGTAAVLVLTAPSAEVSAGVGASAAPGGARMGIHGAF